MMNLNKWFVSFVALALCVCMGEPASAVSANTYTYTDENLGFSLVIPEEYRENLTIEKVDDQAAGFYYTPAGGSGWDGELCQIAVFQPISRYFSDEYDHEKYKVIAFGEDCLYAFKNCGGGTHVSQENEAGYDAAKAALAPEKLQESLTPKSPGVWPRVTADSSVAYLGSENGLFRPEDSLTRGEAAEALYDLLVAENKTENDSVSALDVEEGTRLGTAVAYLEHYGIVAGYADGTFRPEKPVTRAELVVLLHRLQFTPAGGWYGDGMKFSDVSMEYENGRWAYWAVAYLNSAWEQGWIHGYPDGTLRPDNEVTRAQATVIINRMLGREAAGGADGGAQGFRDVPLSHWAYTDILAAAGK